MKTLIERLEAAAQHLRKQGTLSPDMALEEIKAALEMEDFEAKAAKLDKSAAELWDALQAVTKWQLIGSAPKDGTSILACITGFEPSIVKWVSYAGEARWHTDPESFLDESSFDEHWHATNYEPTHWLPIQRGPTNEGQAGLPTIP